METPKEEVQHIRETKSAHEIAKTKRGERLPRPGEEEPIQPMAGKIPEASVPSPQTGVSEVPSPQTPPTPPPPAQVAVKTGMKIGKIILIGGGIIVGAAVIGGIVLFNVLKQRTGISDIELRDDGIKVTTEDDGVLELGTELPSDFPKDFPIYPNNITLDKVLRVSDPDFDEVFNVIWEVKDPYDTVGNYYREALPANGWEITSVLSDVFGVEEAVVITFSKPDRGVSVHITKTGEFECELLAIVSK
jgi:hypothetical protein